MLIFSIDYKYYILFSHVIFNIPATVYKKNNVKHTVNILIFFKG